MTDFTANKGYGQPTVNGNNNSWGPPLNANMSTLDNNLGGGGQQTIDCAGDADITLNAAKAQNLIQNLTGVLTGDINLKFPAVGSFYIVNNQTTGAFTITAITTAAGSTGVLIPQGGTTVIYTDQVNANYALSVGSFDGLIVAAAGIDIIGADAGGLDLRFVNGTYGAGWLNDNTFLHLKLTNAMDPTGAPNGLEPFRVSLASGALTIDGTGAGTTFGGEIHTTSKAVADVAATDPTDLMQFEQTFGTGNGITDVTASRMLGTAYPNNLPRPIFVTITVSSNAAANPQLTIGGVIINGTGSNTPNTAMFACGVVVPGQSYAVAVSAGAGTLLQVTET